MSEKIIKTKVALNLPLDKKEKAFYLLFIATTEELKNYRSMDNGI